MSSEPNADRPGWIWILISLACASAVFVVVAHPSEYGFYTLSRSLVTASAIVNAVFLMAKKPGLAWASVGLAILFNPIMKVHLGRELWIVADVAAVIILIMGGLAIMRPGPTE